MKVEIKDKDKNIVKALNMIGYKIDSKQLEMVLNIAEYVSKKGAETSIRDLAELEDLVNKLYEGQAAQPQQRLKKHPSNNRGLKQRENGNTKR